jgi:hypothetical protein
LQVLDFSATSVAFAKIIEWAESALRIVIVRQSFVINFTVVIEQAKAMFEQACSNFIKVKATRAHFFPAVNMIIRDCPHILPHFNSDSFKAAGLRHNAPRKGGNNECGQLAAEARPLHAEAEPAAAAKEVYECKMIHGCHVPMTLGPEPEFSKHFSQPNSRGGAKQKLGKQKAEKGEDRRLKFEGHGAQRTPARAGKAETREGRTSAWQKQKEGQGGVKTED